MAVRWPQWCSGSARGRGLPVHEDRRVDTVVCAQCLWQPRFDPAPHRNQLTSPMRVAACVPGRTRRQYERVVCDARLRVQVPDSGYSSRARHRAHRARRVAVPVRWRYSRMPQSHARQPCWSRQPHRTPRKHLRESASEAARTPGALARGLACEQLPHLRRTARWSRAWCGDRWFRLKRPTRWPRALPQWGLVPAPWHSAPHPEPLSPEIACASTPAPARSRPPHTPAAPARAATGGRATGP